MKRKNNSLFKARKKNIRSTSEYIFWKGKKLLGVLIIMISIIFLIFSFLPVVVLTTINAYTIGALFGFFSPIFYLMTFFYGLIFVFEGRINIAIKLKYIFIWFFIFALAIFLIGTTIYYLVVINNNLLTQGSLIWTNSYSNWWTSFTSNPNPALPDIINPGIFGFLFFSIFSSIGTSIFSIVIGSLCILIGTFYLILGSPFTKIQEKIGAWKIKKIDEENYQTNVLDLTQEDNFLTETYVIMNDNNIKTKTIESINETQELRKDEIKNAIKVDTKNFEVKSKDEFLENKNNSKKTKNLDTQNISKMDKKINKKDFYAFTNNNLNEDKKELNNTNQSIDIINNQEEKEKTEENIAEDNFIFSNLIDETTEINEKFLPKSTSKTQTTNIHKEDKKDYTKQFENQKIDLTKIGMFFNKSNDDVTKEQKEMLKEDFFPFDDPFEK